MTGAKPFVRVGTLLLALLVCAGLLFARSTGPTGPRTSAPGDGGQPEVSCSSCHASHGATFGPEYDNTFGSMSVGFSGGSTYTPGVFKRVTIMIAPYVVPSNTQAKFGFQATARVFDNGLAYGRTSGQFGFINDTSQTMIIKQTDAPPSQFPPTWTDVSADPNLPGFGLPTLPLSYVQHYSPYTGTNGPFYISYLWRPEEFANKTVGFYTTSVLGFSPYVHPTGSYRNSVSLTYQPPVTPANPVFPAGSLGLETYDTPTNRMATTRLVTSNPLYKTVMKRDGSRVYALTLRGNQLLSINPQTGAVLFNVSILGTAVALSADESYVYVASPGGSGAPGVLIVYDASTGDEITGVGLASDGYYFDIAPTLNGKRIYVLERFGTAITVIDTATQAQLPPITLTSPGNAIAASLDSSRLLVTTQDGTLTTFSTATNAILFQLPVDLTPRGIVFSPDGFSAYVLSQDNTFFVRITTIDVATSMPVAQFWFPSPGFSYFFRISPDGSHFYGGGSANPSNPNLTAWSVAVGGSPATIPSAQGILDIAMPPLPATMAKPGGLRVIP